jgi:preprotein translocase subunit SecD
VATTINRVRELADREHMAETIRNRADANWRAAWWDLTLALSDVAGGDGQVKAAVRAAAEELGQSTKWLYRRRETGLRVNLDQLEGDKIHRLPPRLAVEWTGPIDAEAADTLLAAEQNGVSIRDLAREQGTQPTSWQREGERTVPEPTPERRQEIAREEMTRNPTIIRDVLRDDPAVRRTVQVQQNEDARRHLHDAGIRPNTELAREEAAFGGVIEAMSAMLAAQRNLQIAIRGVRKATLETEDRRLLLSYHDTTERLLKAFGQSLTGDIDAELVDLLEGGS